MPLIDAPEGESLGFSNNVDIYRQFVGPVHLYNKKVISTELGAVQTPPYSLTVNSLLSQVKQSLAAGFTMHVLHGFTYSGPYPNTTWPGYTTFCKFTRMFVSWVLTYYSQITNSLKCGTPYSQPGYRSKIRWITLPEISLFCSKAFPRSTWRFTFSALLGMPNRYTAPRISKI